MSCGFADWRERDIYIYIRIHLVGYISFVSLVAGLRTPLDLSNRNIPLALCIARVWLRFDYQPECKISKIAVENCQFLDHSQNVDFPCALWQTNVAIESGNLKLILPINTVDFPYISYSHSAYEPPRRPGDVASRRGGGGWSTGCAETAWTSAVAHATATWLKQCHQPPIWEIYYDLTVPSLESWLIRGIIPKWPNISA